MKETIKKTRIVCPRMETWKNKNKPNMILKDCIYRFNLASRGWDNGCAGCDFPVKMVWKLCGG